MIHIARVRSLFLSLSLTHTHSICLARRLIRENIVVYYYYFIIYTHARAYKRLIYFDVLARDSVFGSVAMRHRDDRKTITKEPKTGRAL